MIEIYENQGYEKNPPDYIFDFLEFIGTCGACPEQYDVVISSGSKRYLVGYVRLRHGGLSVCCPDVDGEVVYHYMWEGDGYKGCFDTEEERLEHLEKIAEAIWLWVMKKINKKDEDYE